MRLKNYEKKLYSSTNAGGAGNNNVYNNQISYSQGTNTPIEVKQIIGRRYATSMKKFVKFSVPGRTSVASSASKKSSPNSQKLVLDSMKVFNLKNLANYDKKNNKQLQDRRRDSHQHREGNQNKLRLVGSGHRPILVMGQTE